MTPGHAIATAGEDLASFAGPLAVLYLALLWCRYRTVQLADLPRLAWILPAGRAHRARLRGILNDRRPAATWPPLLAPVIVVPPGGNPVTVAAQWLAAAEHLGRPAAVRIVRGDAR
jgi:hypothetical protein